MIKRIENIFKLTKVLNKNSDESPYLKNGKFNKKSAMFWIATILIITVVYMSYILIKNLVLIDQAILFLNFMLLVLMLVLIFQVIMVSINVYYFSKDMDLILPLPINPIDLLISKFNTIIIKTYFFESIFIFAPLIIYGIYTSSGLLYYINLIITLLIFPILPTLIVSVIMMLVMPLSKFIKNKDIFQIIITFILVFLVFGIIFYLSKNIIVYNEFATEDSQAIEQINKLNSKLININNYFLQINPSINFLNNLNFKNAIINLLKILLYDFIGFIIFIFIGKLIYLKNILKNNIFNTANKINKINLEKKCKKINKRNSYIKKDFKLLFKSPIFFINCIYPTLIMIISLLIISIFAIPNIRNAINNTDLFKGVDLEINLNKICLILCGIQIILTFSNNAVTAISREGKSAVYMKFLPIDYCRQIIYKSMSQIIINGIFIFILILLIKLAIPISLIKCIYILIIANLLNIFNSILMTAMDSNSPNLEWNSEYEVISENNKKIYQYVLTILIILLLTYFSKIFNELNLNISCILIILILIILLIILIIIINKIKNKLFNNIK